MKVGCERCGASYSVADEKVAGRKLKLRCKKCGEAILLNGVAQEPSAEGAEPASGDTDNDVTPANLDAPVIEADASWYVEVDGAAQGPYVFSEVADQLEQGRITLDTLVYGQDFTEWRAASLVPELRARALPPPVPLSARDREPTVEVPLASIAHSMGSDPFADPSQPVASPSPRLSNNELLSLGLQREGTVQFSVDQIRALSSVSPSLTPPAPTAKPGYASGEGSGLIDIRSFGEAPPEEGYRELTGMLASPLDTIAPLSLPNQVRSAGVDLRTKVFAGLAALSCVAVGVVAALAITREPAPAPAAAAAPLPTAPVAVAALAAPTPAPAAEPAAAQAPAPADEAAAEAPAKAAPRRVPSGIASAKSAKPRAARPAAEAEARPEKPAKSGRSTIDIDDLLSGKAKSPEKPKAKGGDSIDDLLDSAVSGKSSPAPKPEPEAKNSGLPQTPGRDDMLAALTRAKAKTAKCKGPGTAKASIKIAGSGKVSSVSVSGVEGAAKSCVESAVRSTPFPKFQKDVFEVAFPFALKG